MNYFDFHNGPLVEGDEVIVTSENAITLYDGNTKTQWRDGKLSLTTHSIIYQAQDKENTILKLALKLSRNSGESPSFVTGSLFNSDKIVLPLPSNKHVKLSFRKGGANGFYEHLKTVLNKEAWKVAEAPAKVSKAPTAAAPSPVASKAAQKPATSRVVKPQAKEEDDEYKVDTYYTADRIGIAGVMQTSNEAAQMKSTFKDIDDVMTQASSLVQNIKLLKQRAQGTSEQDSNDFAALESIEETLGLGAMVKARGGKPKIGSAQSKYYAELANELHAWMTHPRNAKSFGTMPIVPLIELFSVYNKARSGELVSPDDVLMACKEIASLSNPMYTLETLSSGRMALINKDTSIILNRLTGLIGPRLVNTKSPLKSSVKPTQTVPTTTLFPRNSSQLRSVNEVQLADKISVSSSVARDLLEQLERDGYLCRSDSGFGCATFYWNIFLL